MGLCFKCISNAYELALVLLCSNIIKTKTPQNKNSDFNFVITVNTQISLHRY